MSKIKLFLDVVEDMDELGQCLKAAADKFCHLAGSIKTVAQALREGKKPEALPAPESEAAPKPKEKPLDAEAVRAVLNPRIKMVGRETIRDLILKHGAPRLTDLNPALYPALVADAKALVSDEEVEAYLASTKGQVE